MVQSARAFPFVDSEVQAVEYLRLLCAVEIRLHIMCFIYTFSSNFVQYFLETHCHTPLSFHRNYSDADFDRQTFLCSKTRF